MFWYQKCNPKQLKRKGQIFAAILILIFVTSGIVILKPRSNLKLDDFDKSSKTKTSQKDILGTTQPEIPQSTGETDVKSKFNFSPTPLPSPFPTPTLTPTSKPTNGPNNNLTEPTITAQKLNFTPTFSVSLDNFQPSATSVVNLEFGSTSGDWFGMGIKIVIPAGFEVAGFGQLDQNTQIGEGNANGIINGKQTLITFIILNQSDTQEHKAKWILKFTNKKWPEKAFLVDGTKDTGNTLTFDGPVPLSMTSPVTVKFKIYSNTIINPSSGGFFDWKIKYIFADGDLEANQKIEIK